MMRLLVIFAATVLSAAPARFARLGQFSGTAEMQLRAGEPFRPAVQNTPIPQGARVRTESARLETELDDGSVLRLTGTSLAELSDYTALSTGQHITSIALDEGTFYFTGRPHENDTLSLAAPGAQVTLRHRARLRFEISSNGTEIAVLEGRVRFATPTAELDLREGQLARVPQSKSGHFQIFREIPQLEADDWSRKRDLVQEGSLSATHLPGIRFGAADLDMTGSWLQTDDAGLVWKPKVTETWAPFQSGTWQWYGELGYTWVAAEDWGWAPYHYGRWLQHNALGWVWVPGSSSIFKPGEVYWMRNSGLALWGPLAPNEAWTAQEPARQFAALNTSVAPFIPGQRTLDPAAEVSKPKDLLSAARFTVALPSPPFIAARLDETNLPLRSAPFQLTSSPSAPEVQVSGASFEPRLVEVPPATVAPPPTRTVVIDRPVYVEVPETLEVYYPFPVYSGFIVLNPAVSDGRRPKKKEFGK